MSELRTEEVTYLTGRHGLYVPKLEHFSAEHFPHNRDFAIHNLLTFLYFKNFNEPIKENAFSEISIPETGLHPTTIIRAMRKRLSVEQQSTNQERARAAERRDPYAGYSPNYGNPDYKIGSTIYEIVTLDPDSISPPLPFISSEAEDRLGHQYSPVERATITWRGQNAYDLIKDRDPGKRNLFYNAIMQHTVGMLRG